MNTKTLTRAAVLGLSLAVAGFAQADSLGKDMKTMAQQLRAFNQSETPAQATQALDAFKAAAAAAKQSVPSDLHGAQQADYRKTMDQLIAETDKVRALAKAGKLDQAKAEGKKLVDIRNEGHKKFKH